MFDGIMRRFGWERRETSSFTDALVQSILGRATASVGSAVNLAALEACAGLAGRAFASATVTGDRAAALTPRVLMIAGRSLVRKGETVFLIRPGGNGAVLVPAGTWSITGTHDPNTWTYELSLPGPSRTGTRSVSGSDVVHVLANADPERPWRGIAPTQGASLTADLAASATQALGDEAAGPRGSFLPIPGTENLDSLSADIKNARGKVLLGETMADSFGADSTPPKRDWSVQRFGFDAPATLASVAELSSDWLMAAVGLSAAMFRAKDAASATQAYRHFCYSFCSPLGKLLAEEASAKLDSRIALEFADLRAADVGARARGFRHLVDGGMPIDKALAVSGLLSRES